MRIQERPLIPLVLAALTVVAGIITSKKINSFSYSKKMVILYFLWWLVFFLSILTVLW